MRRLALALLVGLLVLSTLAPPLEAKRGPKVVEEEDGKYTRLYLEDDPKAQGWLYRPATDEETPSKPVDLIVALHGAGGNPKNFVMPLLMDLRGSWCLTVAGRQQVQTERGVGYQWDGGNVAYIVALTEYLIGTYPIAKDRVIVWGHSAGGTMTLATLRKAPTLFAGGLTTAAPGVPDSGHKTLRTCVFLGKEDPNWAGASSVRTFVEACLKKGKGACAFFAVDELGHDIPYDDYLGLGFDWILHGKARGGEANVPRRSRGTDGDYRHILVRTKGARGADGVKRSAAKAKKLLKGIKKELDKNRAFFRFEAAMHSEHEDTASCGGGIDTDDLKEMLGEIPVLEPETVSEILESPYGFHLVWRPAPDEEESED